MNLRATYDRIGSDWHRDHQKDDWWIEGTDRFVSMLPQCARVLDAGCGSGVKARYLAQRDLRVVGIDFSQELIGIAREENPGVDFWVMDMNNAGDLNGDFDAVFAQASLLHFSRKELLPVMEALGAKLIAGGYFYAAVKGPKLGQPLEEMKEENDYGYPYQRFFSYYSPMELDAAFDAIGVETVWQDVKRTGSTDWVQLIGRKA